ncbi:hypothetical protein PUN28_001111 [Cardiocondyla obscurior]|uniref:Uncharacterized protein n=1 Tax=Cardiocondyla obscurior TaxID=286306 RepID=A0AAW2H317_9HYME
MGGYRKIHEPSSAGRQVAGSPSTADFDKKRKKRGSRAREPVSIK